MSDKEALRQADEYGLNIPGNRALPRLVVTEDCTLTDAHEGDVHVEAGAFRLAGSLRGNLDLMCGVQAFLSGTQRGNVAVAKGATVVVTGAIQGRTQVASGGVVIVEATGRILGFLVNDGEVVIRGMFGGYYAGSGKLRLECDGLSRSRKAIQ
ncbi:MAG: hypothetical protein M0009_09805 [Deltaproteobacteria bacterium]|nr:hypothetical protein [Deltaproteobacteria bacterium]